MSITPELPRTQQQQQRHQQTSPFLHFLFRILLLLLLFTAQRTFHLTPITCTSVFLHIISGLYRHIDRAGYTKRRSGVKRQSLRPRLCIFSSLSLSLALPRPFFLPLRSGICTHRGSTILLLYSTRVINVELEGQTQRWWKTGRARDAKRGKRDSPARWGWMTQPWSHKTPKGSLPIPGIPRVVSLTLYTLPPSLSLSLSLLYVSTLASTLLDIGEHRSIERPYSERLSHNILECLRKPR